MTSVGKSHIFGYICSELNVGICLADEQRKQKSVSKMAGARRGAEKGSIAFLVPVATAVVISHCPKIDPSAK